MTQSQLEPQFPQIMHRRPPQDERIVCLNVALIAYAGVQLFVTGPPPTSINARGFDPHTNVAYLIVLVAAAGFVLAAALPSVRQYWSFGLELIGCVGLTVLLGLFAWVNWRTTHNAGGTQSFVLNASLTVGCFLRAVRIVRRLRGLDL